MIGSNWVLSGILFIASLTALLLAYVRAAAIHEWLLDDADWRSTKVLRGEELIKVVGVGTALVSCGVGGLAWLAYRLGVALPPGADWLIGFILAIGIGTIGLIVDIVSRLISRARRAPKQ